MQISEFKVVYSFDKLICQKLPMLLKKVWVQMHPLHPHKQGPWFILFSYYIPFLSFTVMCIWEFTPEWPGSGFLLPFLSPLRYKGVTYLFRKPKAILKKRSNQNWKSFIHSVSKLVRMKEELFHSNQFWHTVDEAFPILIAAFNQNCFELSKEVCNSFVSQGA